MKQIPFWKTETVGNHFVLVHADAIEGLDPSEVALRMCSSRFGIGSDGLLVLRPGGEGEADAVLRMFNTDGTEDFCGNGLRCAAFRAKAEGWVGDRFSVEQYGRTSQMEIQPDGWVQAEMPPASFAPASVPMTADGEWMDREVEGVRGTALTTGSAHFVAMVEELPGDEQFFSVSPKIENHEMFPERISVMWTQAVDERTLKMRIWERGVGETLGCGTGGSAAAIAWARKQGLNGEFRVISGGGEMRVLLESWDGPIRARSQPREPFAGLYDWS